MALCNELNLDILVLTETNTPTRSGKFIDTLQYGYNSFWTGNTDKIKGSGIGILVANHLHRFISKSHEAISNYVLHITFLFRGCNLHIIGIYYPPNDVETQTEIYKYIQHTIHQLKRDPLNRTVILGDFNSIPNRLIDRSGNSRFYKRASQVLLTLQQYLYIDTFRYLHPDDRRYTWCSRQTPTPTPICSRIDQIWVSPNWFSDITYCDIEDMSIVTGSDHNMATCLLHTGNIIRNHKMANQKRRDPPRIIYDFKNATSTHWDLFTGNSRDIFARDVVFHRALTLLTPNQTSIDKIWSCFQTNVRDIAEVLPHKVSSNKMPPKPKTLIDIRPRERVNDAKSLRKIISQVAQSNSITHINLEVDEWNRQLDGINSRADLNIPHIPYPPDVAWASTNKSYLKLLFQLIKTEAAHLKDIAIKERLVIRAEDTITNQSRMLASILNRDRNSIHLDRLVVMENSKPVLYTHPDDIKRLAPLQYKAILTPRQHQFDSISDEWKIIYDPIHTINPSIYSDLTSPPSAEEWANAIAKCSPSSAAGLSGISYRHIKKLHPDVHENLRTFAGQIFATGIIPTEWKTSQLFPIPKPSDWNFQLNNTRPILLLECLRKLIIRILNSRLANIMITHDVLKGPNFAGLPGGSTKTPIHVLHNIFEHARETKSECWAVFQDMSRAFDSIGMVPLRRALERIKIPELTITLLLNLFKNRKTRIITAYGLSDVLTAADGIDQGEVISPLIWRIFYDPLLCRITQDNTLGYKMSVQWPTGNLTTTTTHSLRTAGLAYADDTIWIGSSRPNAQRIVDISRGFFNLNDIDINGYKSYLMVINLPKSLPRDESYLIIGKDRTKIYPAAKNEPIRYLGVWFTTSSSQKHQHNIVKEEILNITAALKSKSLTIDQTVYINNKVLIPRLEYRLSTTLLPMMTAHKLFTPMTKTAKQAMGIASSSHTNIITHTGITGLITLRQNQIVHHFTEFTVRVNENTIATTSSLIRLRQFQLQNKITTPIWNLPYDDFKSLSTCGNLSASILGLMKTMDFELQPTSDAVEWSIPGCGMDMISFINQYAPEDRITKALKSIRNSTLPIFWINQCLDETSSTLTPYKVIKCHYAPTSKGRTPLWFLTVENCIDLYNPQDDGINTLAIVCPLLPASTDRRKKEWIFTDTTQDETTVGKIIEKSPSRLNCTVAHWSLTDPISSRFSPCSGCSLARSNNTNNLCSFNMRIAQTKSIPSAFLGTLSTANPSITIHIDSLAALSNTDITRPSNHLISPRIILHQSIDEQLIRTQIHSSTLVTELIEIWRHSVQFVVNAGPTSIIAYTDGSLASKHIRRDLSRPENISFMGSGWHILQTNKRFNCGSQFWPSSTKAELIAIWTFILTLPSNSNSIIITDSQAAIDGIRNSRSIPQVRQLSKNSQRTNS